MRQFNSIRPKRASWHSAEFTFQSLVITIERVDLGKYEEKSTIIRNAVIILFILTSMSFRATLLRVVSILLFLRRFDVARSVPLSPLRR
jgi:hypothetical protein